MVLSFCLLLPVNLISIAISSALESPTLPFLGIPIFISGKFSNLTPGFPRPQRVWPRLQTVIKGQGESQIYKSLCESFIQSQSELLQKFPYQFKPQNLYLLRVAKYLAFVQVCERGSDYITY